MRRVETEEDWKIVWDTLVHLSWIGHERGNKQMHKHASPDKVYATMEQCGEVWLVDGYLVYFAISEPWFSYSKILSELLIVRVETGGTFNSVTRFLKEQARAAGAAYVAVGTSFAFSDRGLSKLYQAEGFVPEATILTSEV